MTKEKSSAKLSRIITKAINNMSLITTKLKSILNKKNLTVYKLSKLMNFSEGALRKMISSKSAFSEKAITKLLPILEISREEFDSWTVADKYSKEIIELAIKVKQEKSRVCHPALDAGSNKQTGEILDRQVGAYNYGSRNRLVMQPVRNDKRGKLILTTKTDAILEEKEMSRTALAKQIKYSQSSINAMIIGKRNISKSVLERMSEALEVSQDEITSWIVADSYSLGTLKMAYAN